MNKSKFTRIIPIALTLVIAAVAIAALISFARFLFFPNSTTTTSSVVDVSKEALLNTSTDRSVVMIVRGPIVANEQFKSYKIRISSTSRTLTVYRGYLNEVIKTISLGNNIPAYEQLVYALNKANMVKGAEAKGVNNDLRGICASGNVFEYQILKTDAVQKGLWTSSCVGSRGSLDASSVQLNSLFIAQIPDAGSIINQVWQ